MRYELQARTGEENPVNLSSGTKIAFSWKTTKHFILKIDVDL